MTTKPMGMRLPLKQEQEIGALVEAGVYLSKGEFIREAIRDKLQSLEVLELRNVDYPQAKKEILDFITKNPGAWTSDIADRLRLDLDLVLAVLKDLRAEGKVEPDDHS